MSDIAVTRYTYVTTERAALVTDALRSGATLTADEVAELTGIGPISAYYMLCKISRVLPVLCIDGVWQWMPKE